MVTISDDIVYRLGFLLAGFGIGWLIAWLARAYFASLKATQAERAAIELERRAQEDATQIKKAAQLEAKEQLVELKKELERRFAKETRDKREELAKVEARLTQKEQRVDQKQDEIEKTESVLVEKTNNLEKMRAELGELRTKELQVLESTAGMSSEEARKQLFEMLEQNLSLEMARRLKRFEDDIKVQAERKAQWVIGTAIGRVAMEQTMDPMVSVVPLPDEDMKGRIIGREGRNIRHFENLTGISVIIDDTPQAVVLSGFNGVKREIARVTLERLIKDGRIHPARIEELFAKASAEMEANIVDIGERTLIEAGIGGVHAELVKLIGQLQYRTSYGQNQLLHSREVMHLTVTMASELKVDLALARRGGLLHDIGKVVSHEIEGPHALVGADLARKYGESPRVVNCIMAHHEDCDFDSVEAVLVAAADALSAGRPGARHEGVDTYVKRVETLEKIAQSFPAVAQAFALSAGREIRVIVKPEVADDVQATKLSREIKSRIEAELDFPGQIKVVVIREVRAIEYAR